MITIYIKQCGHPGKDAKTYRAYFGVTDQPIPSESMRVSCSCTGNVSHGVRNCATKAFIKFYEPKAEREEIETRIAIAETNRGFWIATLQPKKPDLAAKGGQS